MENKTLNTIQILSKIGMVISKIVYICCIVGTIGCIIGIVSFSSVGFNSFKIGGVTIHSIIESSANQSMGTILSAIVVGLILCIFEGLIAKSACRYFKNELAAGTPFTIEGAKEMLHLGIRIICYSVGGIVAAQIAQNIISRCMENVEDISIVQYGGVGLGVTFIIVSVICKYGAELQETKTN